MYAEEAETQNDERGGDEGGYGTADCGAMSTAMQIGVHKMMCATDGTGEEASCGGVGRCSHGSLRRCCTAKKGVVEAAW